MSAQEEGQPTSDQLRFLAEMGMTEVEPGRWMSDWQGGDSELQEWVDSQGPEGQEQLDLLMRAGRVKNEVHMEQTGTPSAVSVQRIPSAPMEHQTSLMPVFVAVKMSSVAAFEAVESDKIQRTIEDVMEQYSEMLPPDLAALSLRKLGIKCKTIWDNPENTGPRGPDPKRHPGFKVAIMHFPGATYTWIETPDHRG